MSLDKILKEDKDVSVIKCNSEIESDYILFNLDYNAKDMKICLDVVRNYIIENQLMIVGGMSIDFALRVKGEYLYSDYQIPDYDVIDPNNIKHANNIASILCGMGMKNISIVPAVHKTTMRVQLMGYTVFDSTYCARYLYEKIPFMKWDNYKFIDPVYQKIDQYTSLSLLWNITGPTFNVINRFEKDIKRKDMLNKHYLFEMPNLSIDENKSIKKSIRLNLKTVSNQLSQKNITNINIYSSELDFVFHGKLAYCLLLEEFNKICSNKKIEVERNHNMDCVLNITEDIISFDFYGNDIEFINYGNNFEENKIFNSMLASLDISNFTKSKKTIVSTSLPSRTIYSSSKDNIKVNVMDLTGNMLSINSVKIKDNIFHISNYNYILAYFLFSYYFSEEPIEKYWYAKYYLSTLEMVNIIQTNTDFGLESLEDNCFFYSLNTLGVEYWIDENLLFYMQNYVSVQKTRKGLSTIPPKNYISYPDCDIKKQFSEEDKKKSHFYYDKIEEVSATNFLKELSNFI